MRKPRRSRRRSRSERFSTGNLSSISGICMCVEYTAEVGGEMRRVGWELWE